MAADPHAAGKNGPSNDHQHGRITQLSLGPKLQGEPIKWGRVQLQKKHPVVDPSPPTYPGHAAVGLRIVSRMRFIPSPRTAAKVVKDVCDEGITQQGKMGKTQMGCNKLYSTDSTTWPGFQKLKMTL